ncbi:hypothetical protein [Streptomyces yunnanensis]|uniref:hypothetical protein n=1 Tax=Streptomyces yunnanensis TaxID=156453 RepID=UPI00256FEE04|nr:hypothetical protein [Streptomyces yunnanensis]
MEGVVEGEKAGLGAQATSAGFGGEHDDVFGGADRVVGQEGGDADGYGFAGVRSWMVKRMFSPRSWWVMPSVRDSRDSGVWRP